MSPEIEQASKFERPEGVKDEDGDGAGAEMVEGQGGLLDPLG